MSLDDAIAQERERLAREQQRSDTAAASRATEDNQDQAVFQRLRDDFMQRAHTQVDTLPVGFWEWKNSWLPSNEHRHTWVPLDKTGWMLTREAALLDDGTVVDALEVEPATWRGRQTFRKGPARSIALNVDIGSTDGETTRYLAGERLDIRPATLPRPGVTGPAFEAFWSQLFARVLVSGHSE